MNTRRCAPALLVALVFAGVSATIPADAKPHDWNNWNNGKHNGWYKNGNNNNQCNPGRGAWNNTYNRNGNVVLASNPYNTYGNRWNYGMLRTNSDLYREQQSIINRMAAGNLSPSQQSRLQNRLTRIQQQTAGYNTQINGQLLQEQSYLQNLLNSGNLSGRQRNQIEDRLSQIQLQQNSLLGTGNPFANTSIWNNFRNVLGF